MRIIIVTLLLAAIAGLTAALFFLMKDRSTRNRTVYALTVRIGLSLLLFIIIIGGYLLGFISPNPPPI